MLFKIILPLSHFFFVLFEKLNIFLKTSFIVLSTF